MQFSLRSSEDILDTIMNYMTLYSSITDENVGGVILTFAEAVSQELGEQNFQISQILKVFSVFQARGADLDRRVADFGIYRLPARAALTKVRFFDSTVPVGKSSVLAAAGATSLKLFDSSMFPTTGYPYVVRVNEGSALAQNLTVSGNNLLTATLTVNATTYAVDSGSPVNLVTGQPSRLINSGVQVQVPVNAANNAKLYVTTEQAFIEPGNTYSNEVVCKSISLGEISNGPAGSIRGFTSSPPFSGASVSNTTVISGGRDVERDEELQRRAVEQIFGLSSATKKALKSAAKQVEDPITGSKVKSASVVEDFENDEVIIYIDNGSGNVLDYATMQVGTVGGSAAGTSLLPLSSGITAWPESGSVLIFDGAVSELMSYSTKTATALILSSNATYSHLPGTTAYSVEEISSSTEANQTLFSLAQTAITRDSEIIFVKTPTGLWQQLSRASDYTLNRGTGEFVLASSFPAGSKLVANYSYNTSLAAEVIKVLEGDPQDTVNYPGVKAAGIRLSVENPIIRRVPVICLISAKPGYDEIALRASAEAAVQQYFSSLEIGDDVVIDRIRYYANNVQGISSVTIIEPKEDVVLLEREQASCFSASGDSLLIVS
jgi:uncharacterized phage protein gp47/JayE